MVANNLSLKFVVRMERVSVVVFKVLLSYRRKNKKSTIRLHHFENEKNISKNKTFSF